jgi:hypothetical protein
MLVNTTLKMGLGVYALLKSTARPVDGPVPYPSPPSPLPSGHKIRGLLPQGNNFLGVDITTRYCIIFLAAGKSRSFNS